MQVEKLPYADVSQLDAGGEVTVHGCELTDAGGEVTVRRCELTDAGGGVTVNSKELPDDGRTNVMSR